MIAYIIVRLKKMILVRVRQGEEVKVNHDKDRRRTSYVFRTATAPDKRLEKDINVAKRFGQWCLEQDMLIEETNSKLVIVKQNIEIENECDLEKIVVVHLWCKMLFFVTSVTECCHVHYCSDTLVMWPRVARVLTRPVSWSHSVSGAPLKKDVKKMWATAVANWVCQRDWW